MKKWFVVGILSILSVASAELPKKPITSTTFIAVYADRYDRYMWSNNKRFYFYFSTDYKVKNQSVSPAAFWNMRLSGRQFQAKIQQEGRFFFIKSINMLN